MKRLIPLLAGLAALPLSTPASAQVSPLLAPGSYVQEMTVDVEIVDSETGTLVDSWTDHDRFLDCRDTEAALTLGPELDRDPRCAYEETGRGPGHVDFLVTCDFDEMLMSGTGTLDYHRADLTGFAQTVSLFGYAGGQERRMTLRETARRTGACPAELR
ncbi:MAG: hypothetical protein R3B98_01840 [Hyphomonas sp.]